MHNCPRTQRLAGPTVDDPAQKSLRSQFKLHTVQTMGALAMAQASGFSKMRHWHADKCEKTAAVAAVLNADTAPAISSGIK